MSRVQDFGGASRDRFVALLPEIGGTLICFDNGTLDCRGLLTVLRCAFKSPGPSLGDGEAVDFELRLPEARGLASFFAFCTTLLHLLVSLHT